MPNVLDTVVVGAGITGLSCAWRLHSAGRSVLLLERGSRVGGVIHSERIPGVGVIDHGPQTLRSGDPALLAEFRELGIEEDRCVAGAAGSHRYVFWQDRLVPLPHSPVAFLRSPILPTSAKLRLLLEPFARPRRDQDESVEDFFRHRLGRHAVERLVDPFVSGVYAGDPRQLSMRSVFPALKEGVDRKGSLLRWAVSRARAAGRARRERGTPRSRPQLFSFKEGLGQWPRALEAALGPDRVRTGVDLKAVRRAEGHWALTGDLGGSQEEIRARVLVLAIPAPGAAALLGGGFPADSRPLMDIPYAPVSTVHLAWRREDVGHPLDGFGYLCPSSQDRPVLGTLWISSLFPQRVEEGVVLTTSFVGGARVPEQATRPPQELVGLAVGEHRRTLGARGEPLEARVVTYPRGIPQYEFGHEQRVEAAARMEASAPDLYLTGSWRGGVSVPDCWAGGRATADRVLSEWGRSSSLEVGRTEGSPPRPYRERGRPGSPTGPAEGGT